MKQNAKHPIRTTVLFLGIGLFLFFTVQYILTPKWSEPAYEDVKFALEFYELDRNELDVLFLGNSHLYYGVSPLKIYGDQKFVSFIIGSANQRMPISYYLLKQALLFQRPKLVVLEVSSLMNEYTTLEYPWERAAMFLRSPRCLLECANTYGELAASLDQDDKIETMKKFLIPIYRYHSRWSSLTEYDFQFFPTNTARMKGNQNVTDIKGADISIEGMNSLADSMRRMDALWTISYENGQESIEHEELEPLYYPTIYETELEYFKKIVELCWENDILLLGVVIPATYNPVAHFSAWTRQRYEVVKDLLASLDVPYLDMMYDVDLGIDLGNDSVDGGKHLNMRGAYKVSEYLGQYLKDNYDLPDHEDVRYERDLELYNSTLPVAMLQTELSFPAYIERLKNFNHNLTVCFAASNCMTGRITEEDVEVFRSIGMQTDFLNMGVYDTFVGIWEHSANGTDTIPYEAASTRELQYETETPEGLQISLVSRGGVQGGYASINLNGEEYVQGGSSLHCVVYCNDTDTVIDTAYFDLFPHGDHCMHHLTPYTWLRNWEQLYTDKAA